MLWMLKICQNLKTGTLFEQLSWRQIMSKFEHFCAHQEGNDETILLSTENVQISHLRPKLWAFEKKFPQNQK